MIPARTKRAVLARQGWRCACKRGEDLRALIAADKSGLYTGCERKLRGGRPAVVEFDHIIPRHEAEYRDGRLVVFFKPDNLPPGVGICIPLDHPLNIQALWAPCHAEKCEGEREDYPQAAPAVHSGVRSKPQAEYRPVRKTARLRWKAPRLNHKRAG